MLRNFDLESPEAKLNFIRENFKDLSSDEFEFYRTFTCLLCQATDRLTLMPDEETLLSLLESLSKEDFLNFIRNLEQVRTS